MTELIVAEGACVTVKDESLLIRPVEGAPITLDRVACEVTSIVFDAGGGGYMSFAAMGWLAQHNITYVMVYRDLGAVLTSVDTVGKQELHRAQAQSVASDAITRALLGAKLAGQARNAEAILGDSAAAEAIRRHAVSLAGASGNESLTSYEGHGAKRYWQAWAAAGVCAPFAASEGKRIPAHWVKFTQRKSLHGQNVKGKKKDTTQQNRNATDPVNALLNLAYDRGEALCGMALQAHGLSPVFGLSHKREDRRNQEQGTIRQSMALDLLEVIRPDIDAIVLGILSREGSLRFRDFLQKTDGTVRVTKTALKHEIWAAVRELEPVVMYWAGRVREYLQTGEVPAGNEVIRQECARRITLALAA